MVLNTLDGTTGHMHMSDQDILLASVKAEPIHDGTAAAASTSSVAVSAAPISNGGGHLVYASVKRQRVEG